MPGNVYRPVQIPAKLVVAERRWMTRRLWIGSVVLTNPGVGIEERVTQIFENSAMVVVGAALGNDAHLSAGRPAILRLVAGSQNLYLRCRVHVGHTHAVVVRARAYHGCPVPREKVFLGSRAIHV